MELTKRLTRYQANFIYDFLVITCKAREGDDAFSMREQFLNHVLEDEYIEFRFQGCLGFGGKFHMDDWRMRVSCYSEDETPENLELIGRINSVLELFYSSFFKDAIEELSDETMEEVIQKNKLGQTAIRKCVDCGQRKKCTWQIYPYDADVKNDTNPDNAIWLCNGCSCDRVAEI